MKRNERDWAGQLISWIQEAIREGRSIFEDATNDKGIKVDSGRTKFPDILLFIDKTSGIVFNGWELKFPDTAVDDLEMLENAIEKAQKLRSNSFVTWNGAEAIIWKIKDENYSLGNIERVKQYPKENSINGRDDLSDPLKFNRNADLLKRRAYEILHDLGQLFEQGDLKEAIDISSDIVNAISEASQIIIPQFQKAIITKKGEDESFRIEYNQWKIYESSTLKILASSSRRPETVIGEEVLAKFTFYNFIGKVLFYLTLSDNLEGEIKKINVTPMSSVKGALGEYFDDARRIDYQAIFKPYFTDNLDFSEIVNKTLFQLILKFTDFDFKILPTEVIGTILENLVPKAEKQKFGQYFTSETLADLVTYPSIKTFNDYVFDPTSGTGTFLTSFYNILKYHGNTNHSQLLNQIWGNDISHFPAILSVINLYKQEVSRVDNFPRVIRDDFFNLKPKGFIIFPDSIDYKKHVEQQIPEFDAIASNFPFIQQEDIPNNSLVQLFRGNFEVSQQAFLRDANFKINERSDYFTYCIYNSIRFLKIGGRLSAITSNAWLGKEYGMQFKKFLLDNFHVKYVVKSNAEHWFSDSKVSTIFSVFELGSSDDAAKFVTLNFKLENRFDKENIERRISQIEALYAEIDNCDNSRNTGWRKDSVFDDLYIQSEQDLTVCIVPKHKLIESLSTQENWSKYFISANLFEKFDNGTVNLYPIIVDVFRGERTGWNTMFILNASNFRNSKIEGNFIIPYLKDLTEIDRIDFSSKTNHYLFVCDKPIDELKRSYKGAYNWVKKFETMPNKNHGKTISNANSSHKPFWYSLQPKKANIVTSINPYERFFFSYSASSFVPDQRLVVLNVKNGYQIELIAALLNSILTFLTMEMRGTARNLGVLDLNANDFKNLRVFNPDALNQIQKEEIIKAFEPIKARKIESIFEEVTKSDRINFDRNVLRSFGLNETLLESLYQTLLSAVYDRITMKEK